MYLHHSPFIVLMSLLAMGCGASTVHGDESDGTSIDATVISDAQMLPIDGADGALPDQGLSDGNVPSLDLVQSVDVGQDTGVLQDIPPRPSICRSALLIPARDYSAYSGTTVVDSEPSPPCSMGTGASGRVRWFRLSPSSGGTRVIVSMTDPLPGRPVIRVFECLPTSCTMSSVNPYRLETVTLYLSPAAGRSEHFIAVGADEGDIAFSVGARPMDGAPPQHGTCRNAMPVMNGTRLRVQSLADAVEPTQWCGGADLAALYYTVRVGGRETLEVDATNLAFSGRPVSPGMYLADNCTAASCLATGESIDQGVSRLRWVNTASEPRDVILAVNNGAVRYYPILFSLSVRLTSAASM